MPDTDYQSVTELSGTEVTQEQVDRISHRYRWAGEFCKGKDVAEVACGTGQGLGYLGSLASTVAAGDLSQPIVDSARSHYGSRFEIGCFDALHMPWGDETKDVVVIFEAIYYLPDFGMFIDEARRVLRPGGMLLIATANKDLSDFNPSPYSHEYYGVAELHKELSKRDFITTCFGHISVSEVSLKQRILRPIKKLVVNLGLMPKTMAGKKLLKKLVFGELVSMPAEITEQHMKSYNSPKELGMDKDTIHKVIYCVAKLSEGDN